MRDLQTRTEGRRDAASTVVMNFRVEESGDSGHRRVLVPVEMRGYSFEGAVTNGDLIHARGRLRSGTLRVKQVHNLSTGAVVSVKQTPKIVIALVVMFFVGWFIFLLVLGLKG
ncbi:hypothetical protein [Streptomyces sp. NPDC002265]|uniref:hypothetical protein n=1 Tax=Streptomyces sp. NPDC002265 TaxID=3154415 RepID=UPI00331BB0E6